MRWWTRAIGWAAIAGVVAAVGMAAPEAGPPPGLSAPQADAFIRRLRGAVDRRDRRAVASMAQYPLKALASGLNIPVESPAELVRMYDLFFTPEMRCALASASMARPGKAVPRHAITIAGDGLSIGSGLLWAQLSGPELKIARLSVPPSSTASSSRRASRRVTFPGGDAVPEKFSGLLSRDEVDTFTFSAQAGQIVEASIDGFRGRDAVLRMLDASTRVAMAGESRAGARTWIGRLPSSAVYRIVVARHAPYCDPATRYALIVTVR